MAKAKWRMPTLETAKAWVRRFDERPQRERLLLAGAALALAYFAVDATLLTPAFKAWQTATRQQHAAQMAQLGRQAELAQREAEQLTQTRQRQTELDHWRRRVREGEEALQAQQSALVGPERMLALLDQVLAQHGQVRLRSMQSLGRVDVLQGEAARVAAASSPAAGTNAGAASMPSTARAASQPGPREGAPAAPRAGAADDAQVTLYRHGVELTLEGSFAELLDYLRALQAMPQRVLWGKLSFKVEQHPKATLTLRLYTLSRDRHWLEI